MNKLTYFILFLALGLTACVDDDSRGITTPLPELSIAGSDSETMPVYNVYYGDELTIDPQVQATSQDLSYTWSYGTYTEISSTTARKGELTEISTDPVLRYSFAEKGTYYVHLVVTDGTVGSVMEYRVNVNDYYEKGILVIANSDDGQGNLGFIKELTNEDVAAGMTWRVEEHCLEAVNPDLEVSTIVGADRVTSSSLFDRTESPIMLVSLEDKCLYVNSTTFEINSQSNYDEVTSGFRASHFISSDSNSSNPFVYDKTQGKFIHFQKAYWFIYEYSYPFFHQSYDDIVLGYTFQASTGDLIQDPIFIDYAKPEVSCFDSNMADKAGTGNLLTGKTILMVTHETNTTASTLHIVAQSNDNPLEITQYTVNRDYDFDAWTVFYSPAENGVQTYTASTADGIPAQGTHMALAQDYQVAFYPVDNGLYAYYLLNASPRLPSTPLITYPAGEEITCLNVNVATNELYVGTYTEATGRGNVYIYSVANLRSGNLEPTHEFLQSTDCIVDIRYKN